MLTAAIVAGWLVGILATCILFGYFMDEGSYLTAMIPLFFALWLTCYGVGWSISTLTTILDENAARQAEVTANDL